MQPEVKKLKENIGGDSEHVLNGIAYDKYRDTFIISGKMWDLIF